MPVRLTLCVVEVPFTGSIQLCGVDRAGEVGDKHSIDRYIQIDPDPVYEMGHHDFRPVGSLSMEALLTVLPGGRSPRSIRTRSCFEPVRRSSPAHDIVSKERPGSLADQERGMRAKRTKPRLINGEDPN
jgi:hypothetical protein